MVVYHTYLIKFSLAGVSFLKTFMYIFSYALERGLHGQVSESSLLFRYEPMSFSPTDSQENPELIWNDEAREKVSQEVAQMTEE